LGFLPSLPEPTNLPDVMKQFPKGWASMLTFHDEILRSESEFTIAQRELIAAYVSGLNNCRFCYNAHTMYAESFGIAGDVFEPMIRDLQSAPVEEEMRPVLAYARVLTLEPQKVSQAHIDAILEAGWSEAAVGDAAMVIALYNFMNRIIMGHGVDHFDEHYAERREAVRKQPLEKRRQANEKYLGATNYQNLGKQLGLIEK